MRSPQQLRLSTEIFLASAGNQGSIEFLRGVISEAGKKAPVKNLIEMAQLLLSMGDRENENQTPKRP